MEKAKTLDFLKTAGIAVVASSDHKALQHFLNFISSDGNNAKLLINKCVQYDCLRVSQELKIETAEKIASLNELVKRQKVFIIQPIEILNCEEHLVTARLRAVYFHIPERVKQDIQMFKLHYCVSKLRLECEFGKNAGHYLVYD